jgi:chemotaxis protein CheC
MMTDPTDMQLDVLKELVNLGVGKAAAALNEMLESHIELEVPSITLFQYEKLEEEPEGFGEAEVSCVQLNFRGSFDGAAALVFPPSSAAKLVAALTGEDPETPSLNAVMAGTLNEVGNILINAVIGTIGNVLEKPFDFSLPNYVEGRLEELLNPGEQGAGLTVLLIRTRFWVQDRQVEGNIFLIFEIGFFDALMTLIETLGLPWQA